MLTLQSISGDAVIGGHFHLVIYPGTPPVIAPGAVLGVGLVMPDLVGAVLDFACELIGFPQPDTSVLVHGRQATATGSDTMQLHVPIAVPLAPTEDLMGDTKFYFGSQDVLVGPDAKYAVRPTDIGWGCMTVGRAPPNVVIPSQIDVFSGRGSTFDVGTFAADLVDFVVGQAIENAAAGPSAELFEAAGNVVWNSHEELLAFIENPSEETAAALARKLAEEAASELIDVAAEELAKQVLGDLFREALENLPGARRYRPRPPGLRRRAR